MYRHALLNLCRDGVIISEHDAPVISLFIPCRLSECATYYRRAEERLDRGNSIACMYMLGVLCCFALFVCLTLLASFFLPSHLSFKNMF